MLSVTHISKSFGPIQAVQDVSFTLNPGEVMGFLGPNGAGKTTTMRILTGFLPPSSGQVTLNGLDIQANLLKARQKIGYLPESTPLYTDMEVADYLAFVGKMRGLKPDSLNTGLKNVVSVCSLGKVVGRRISTLSKGYKQRVGLAQALIHDPEVLVLDEPTVGLDPNQIGEIRSLIREIGKNKTVLLSTHILSEVEQTCDRVIIIQDGKIAAQGTPGELMTLTQGGTLYHVGLKAPEEDVLKGASTLPGFQKIEKYRSEGAVNYFRLASTGGTDLREDLFKLAVAKNWVLVELRREEANLETVFKKLTQ